MEAQSNGKVSSAALTSIIRQKLPSAEVEYAVEDALVEEGYAGWASLKGPKLQSLHIWDHDALNDFSAIICRACCIVIRRAIRKI